MSEQPQGHSHGKGGAPLPVVDVDAQAQRRRAAAREARDRRVAREKDLALEAARWLGADLEDGPLVFRDQFTIVVKRARAHDLLQHLRDVGFDFLVDVTAVDYMKHPSPHRERFAVVWHVLNTEQEARLRVRAYLDEDEPLIPTASDIWSAANWAEREAYDMYGIEFQGHPNLIRLLMPADYSGFPLRKDYPLRGRGERDNFPVIRRGGEERA